MSESINIDSLIKSGILKKASEIKSNKNKHTPIDKIVSGEYIKNDYGRFFKKTYSEKNLQNINKLCNSEANIKVIIQEVNITNFDINKTLFFDTETTGLSMGAGTVPFLIGLGKFIDTNTFQITQYFISDFDEELAMLAEIEKEFNSMDFLVSYNGKSFDSQILSNRILMSRSFKLKKHQHIDLLYPARRLFEGKVENCRLGNLEKEILNIKREGKDVPGFMVPDIYFNYVRYGKTDLMPGVFYHNYMDVKSMLSLLTRMNEFFNYPDGLYKKINPAAIIKSYINICDSKNALSIGEKLINKIEDIHDVYNVMKIVSLLYKKLGINDKAVSLWKSMISIQKDFNIIPFEELAKYFEHKEKNLGKALYYTNKCLEKYEQESLLKNSENEIILESLNHRLKRIKNRLK